MKILCEGQFPDEARVRVLWVADKTETVIPVFHNGLQHGSISPNEVTLVPLFIAEILRESSFAVAIISEPEANDEPQAPALVEDEAEVPVVEPEAPLSDETPLEAEAAPEGETSPLGHTGE